MALAGIKSACPAAIKVVVLQVPALSVAIVAAEGVENGQPLTFIEVLGNCIFKLLTLKPVLPDVITIYSLSTSLNTPPWSQASIKIPNISGQAVVTCPPPDVFPAMFMKPI